MAIDMCKQNIEINKLTGKVIPILGDAENEIDKNLKGVATRVLMPYRKRQEFL